MKPFKTYLLLVKVKARWDILNYICKQSNVQGNKHNQNIVLAGDTDPKPCYYTSETYRTVQCKKRTVPFMKRTVPCKKRTVPFKKRTVPFMKRTVPCKKRTVPCKKRSVPFKKRTETFMNFFELISKTTPPKNVIGYSKSKRIRQNDFVTILLICHFIFVDILLELVLILFYFSFHFRILVSCCHRYERVTLHLRSPIFPL